MNTTQHPNQEHQERLAQADSHVDHHARQSAAHDHTTPVPTSPWAVCVAPMMDWTDRHCRVFHRMLSPHARLYTEMVTTGAIIFGDQPRHLDYSKVEHPVALQLGGSEPADLAQCAQIGERWGYDEININCGCPSERVQRGSFGACLMAEPQLVADCVKAMVDVVDVPVTVKHRIGIDDVHSYDFVRDFVGTVAQAGCNVFIAHARNAVLKGLSPKQNREIPPLKYDYVRQLKRDFPHLTIVLNGGLNRADQCVREVFALREDGVQLDGVMIGREAYHRPRMLCDLEQQLWVGADGSSDWVAPTDEQLIEQLIAYAQEQQQQGVHVRAIIRHMLGLVQGKGGAKRFRQLLSDSRQLARNDPQLMREALEVTASFASLNAKAWDLDAA